MNFFLIIFENLQFSTHHNPFLSCLIIAISEKYAPNLHILTRSAQSFKIFVCRLYKAMGEFDVLRGIFGALIKTKDVTQEAIQAESRGDYESALELYSKVKGHSVFHFSFAIQNLKIAIRKLDFNLIKQMCCRNKWIIVSVYGRCLYVSKFEGARKESRLTIQNMCRNEKSKLPDDRASYDSTTLKTKVLTDYKNYNVIGINCSSIFKIIAHPR